MAEAFKWKNCQAVHPPAEEIAAALQDEGELKKSKKKGREHSLTFFPRIDKLAGKLAANVKAHFNPDGFTKNATRVRQPLHQHIVLSRKKADVTETNPFFRQFGKDGQVFFITNNPLNCGLDVPIDAFQEHCLQQINQKNCARTHNDGLRLGCILLDAKHRNSVADMMTKKKNRKKSDQTGDTNSHFFQKTAKEDFLDQSCVVLPPSEEHCDDFPEEDKANWDPNNSTIFEHERDGSWLKSTWEECVRPKHKRALDKWNKDTGGGDGTPASFMNFCGGDRWLAWSFALDQEANFLLASNAGGRMPNHLQVETGFEDSVSALGTDSDGDSAEKRSVAVDHELGKAKRLRVKLDDAMDAVCDCLASKKDTATSPLRDVKKVEEPSTMMTNENALQTMSPGSRELCVNRVKRERKVILKRFMDEEKSNDDNDDNTI